MPPCPPASSRFCHSPQPLPLATPTVGLIYYLPEAAAHRLVASIGSLAAPGSPLYFDYMQLAALTGQAHKYPGFMVTAKVYLQILFLVALKSHTKGVLKMNNGQHCVLGLVCFALPTLFSSPSTLPVPL